MTDDDQRHDDCGLNFHQALEAPIDHPLAVEWRLRFRIHDLVALGARLVGDPGEYHGLARLELDAAGEGREFADLDVLSDPFAVIQRAVFAPELAALLRQGGVSREVFLRDGDDEAIDVRHGEVSCYSPASLR